ncbi:MAG: DUF924 domain-containing protein [Gammaproteobacteria bacterium]|nr:DUF924 domain-containing protein [Gammaproteobacteria bacterium]
MQQVLDFWFSDDIRPAWFRSTRELDALIRDRFEATWRQAADGALDHWAGGADGALALVIVLDQFPLNMFRGRPESFATEGKAIAICRQAIDNGLDRQLVGERRAFLYMPLMHSEDLANQERSVALFEAAGLDDNLRFARHHCDLIRRFGRFPHRNAILGRESTTEEKTYLSSGQAFLG